MKRLPFKKSAFASIGIELEYQIIDRRSFALVSRSKDLIRNIQISPFRTRITPEITQSMIEINSSVHHSVDDLFKELTDLQEFLLAKGQQLNVAFSGGGTHPFQRWALQKIFPTKRYKNISNKYRYLSKRATVFGQHIHFGCTNAENALYLTHALARYVPQFIAISASSPFYQGIDTGYFSSRASVFTAFPLSGVIPFLTCWQDFSDYYYKLRNLGIINSMKDFYWDIRPKPEYGTVELRVCDTPLTFKKTILIGAYLQALSMYLLTEKPDEICQDLYYLYNHNRFQACRYGFEGEFINPYTSTSLSIGQDIIETVNAIEKYVDELKVGEYIKELVSDVLNAQNDASFLRQFHKQQASFQKVVEEQCRLWAT